MHGIRWDQYEVMLAVRGEKSVPRMTYLNGALELMSPSRYHERIKSIIGRCIEAYANERNIELGAYGQWTLKDPPKDAGAEPDECYIFGEDQEKQRPDVVIEVVWTHGGIEKLEIYRRLGVREVWIWDARRITIHALVNDAWERRTRSTFLPDLDLALIEAVVDRRSLSEAVRAFRESLASPSK